MKLIRYGAKNKEKPGVVLENEYYDVSAFGEDYNEEFFEIYTIHFVIQEKAKRKKYAVLENKISK